MILRVKLCIWFCKNFHLFVEEENKVYTCCDTPKKDIALGQELVISQVLSLNYDNHKEYKMI